MNFHAVKWKNLVFICSDGISKSFYATRCNFLHKFEERLSYIAQACVEKRLLYNDLLQKRQSICTLLHENSLSSKEIIINVHTCSVQIYIQIVM